MIKVESKANRIELNQSKSNEIVWVRQDAEAQDKSEVLFLIGYYGL